MERRFDGSRVVVTGGARGIGACIAARFAAEGAQVAVLDRLAEAGSQCASGLGGRFHAVDLADPVAAREATEAAIEGLGGVDVLVASAGIFRLVPLLDITPEAWDEMLAVNARAVLVSMQVAARSMIAAGAGGSIITIASMAAKKGGAREGHYAASKAAVVALTRAAALEWGEHGVRVNALCPGYILTEMGAATRTEEDVRRWSSWSPLGRTGTPEDVAGVAAFLASPDGAYLTGQAINITGGMVMH
ncbi:SDR family NAD(P)-dependent oxidoreductase [Spongisporangium articulatum]|uniref:SDR family NAD(P)-dependent oxidoreductase n=1 Tax=Spongisporangium articulatum TaxID=3362603 RepID=A0ABW8ATD3_9ACTN